MRTRLALCLPLRSLAMLMLEVGSMSAVACSDSKLPAGATPATPSPGPLTLSGTVFETAPTSSTPIANATVKLIEGASIGSATTDAGGAFHLAGIRSGGITVRVQAPNYADDVRFIEMTGDSTVAFQLDPVLQVVTTRSVESLGADGEFCPGYWDEPADSEVCAANYTFNVHHSGTLRAEAVGGEPNVAFLVTLHVSVDGRGLGSGIPLEASTEAPVVAHTRYVVRVRKFSSGGGPPPPAPATFTLTVTRPS